MEKDILVKYKKAGKITADLKRDILKVIKPGMKLLDLVDFIENGVKKAGAGFAFPPNISVNDVTAHYTPPLNDETAVSEGDLVKIDIGVHVDGYIGDMAFTYCSEDSQLYDAAKKAVEEAIKIVKPGVTVAQIGTVIEETIHDSGLGVITNLTGHTLDRFQFHGPPSIFNVKNNSSHAFEEGDVIALEPFVTDTNSQIRESGLVEIYQYIQDRPVRMTEARKILSLARDDYSSLPFAKRWLYSQISPLKVTLALKQLEDAGALTSYPILKEINGRKTAQAEHTIIVSDPPVVTTRGEE